MRYERASFGCAFTRGRRYGWRITASTSMTIPLNRFVLPPPADCPFGGSFRVTVAPETMVASQRLIPFCKEHYIGVEGPRRFHVQATPCGHHTEFRNPSSPCSTLRLRFAHPYATGIRKLIGVCYSPLELDALRPRKKAGEKGLEVGSRLLEVDSLSQGTALARIRSFVQ